MLFFDENVLFIQITKGERTLSLLVENCGRVNYGKRLDQQRKGTFFPFKLQYIVRSYSKHETYYLSAGNV